MTNPYSPLWVSAKVPSLGSGASPFCGRFLVPPHHHQLLLSTRSLSPSHLCLPDSVPMAKYPFQSLVGQIQLGFSTRRTKVKQTLAAPS